MTKLTYLSKTVLLVAPLKFVMMSNMCQFVVQICKNKNVETIK